LTKMEIGYKFIKALVRNIALSDLPIIVALILLASSPFLILQNENELANQLASYSFYLLIAGIIWKSIEYLIRPHLTQKSSKLEAQS
jgi:cytosine/uracil/thiamine/allantoin permease